jgi:uncharacterized protein (DUF1697 family)
LTRHIAFLRAINVGGHGVKMDQLRSLFEQLAFAEVQTFIASGNVVFGAARKAPDQLERVIETHLKKSLGYEVTTFVRSPMEIVRVVESSPFGDREIADAHTYVLFLKREVSAAERKALRGLTTAVDEFETGGRELYWLRRRAKERAGEPSPPIERVLKIPATSRNMTTVRKIAAKFCQ